MIIPLVGETEWTCRLERVAVWEPSRVPMVVVAPHPDDETLASGGLIAAQRARGVDVTVVAVTDGENAYEDNRGLAEIRREEQTCALARLGVPRHKIVRLGLIDSNVAAQEKELITRLRMLITAGTQVFAPWVGDFHPDHEACARATEVVVQDVGATLISYFFWTWHRGTIASLDGLKLQKFALNKETLAAKWEGLARHASQLKHAAEPEILPANLLWPARIPFEVFAL
jgi:LmbE family N-acetylglucosaminyl deacetylase